MLKALSMMNNNNEQVKRTNRKYNFVLLNTKKKKEKHNDNICIGVDRSREKVRTPPSTNSFLIPILDPYVTVFIFIIVSILELRSYFLVYLS